MRQTQTVEPGEWLISLSSWVIKDGNYPDFTVGEKRRFALEYFSHDLVPAAPGTRQAHPLGDARYEITAEVVAADDELAVLEFGLLAYSDSRPSPAAVGDWRHGTMLLEIDCYSYFEIHAKREHVPAAVYSWTITGIWRQTAPFIPGVVQGMKAMVRDQSRLGWLWLDRTDAWSDDEGSAEYLLRCRVEPDPAVRHPQAITGLPSVATEAAHLSGSAISRRRDRRGRPSAAGPLAARRSSSRGRR